MMKYDVSDIIDARTSLPGGNQVDGLPPVCISPKGLPRTHPYRLPPAPHPKIN